MNHGATSYENSGCRCDRCTEEHRRRILSDRDRRAAGRVLVDGRMVATMAARHGRDSTYTNWSCRCVPCTDAHRVALRRRTTPERRQSG